MTHSARDAALAALGWNGGPLTISGVAATTIVDSFGSPTYVYDAAVVRAQVAAVRGAFGARVGVLFALKANPSAAVARVARGAGAGLEVASAGEIAIARAAGFAGTELQFAGPGKSDLDLATALEHGVAINLESFREHRRLAEMARRGDLRPRVRIRVNPNAAQAGSRLRMADESSRFGVDRDLVAGFAREIDEVGVCELVGLHVYGGSQSFDAEAWAAGAVELIDTAAEVAAQRGRPLAALNFGGGFGWPVYDGDPTFDLASAGRNVQQALAAHPEVVEAHVEPGRYLTAPAGVYLTRVVDLKTSGGKLHAVLDGGMHHFGAAAGMGAVMRRAYAIVSAADPGAEPIGPISLGGPLCTPADRFGRELPLPALAVGDVVAILNAGAYGLSFSPTSFLGHRSPAEVLIDGGRARLVRNRGTIDDAMRGQAL